MELMKNSLNQKAIQRIAKAFKQLQPDFNQQAFSKQALAGLETLELKQRVAHIISALHNFLPTNFKQTAKLLQQIPKVWDYGPTDDPFRSFAAWPIVDYVAVYGLAQVDIALQTLKQLTPLFSAEFAIRPFLLAQPEYCQQQLIAWAQHPNEHIRRLVSEGTRPRLPWGLQLKPCIKDPSSNLLLLEYLKADSSLYVRRSVANHLNDIAKDHPGRVIELCKRWQASANDETNWVIKHATRTLVKNGHPEVFALLGYSNKIQLQAIQLGITKTKLNLGDALTFKLNLQSSSNSTQQLVIDFAIHFVKANGQRKPKVFKLKNITLAGKQSIDITKTHPIKIISTRRYYPGKQLLAILINGKQVASEEFTLNI